MDDLEFDLISGEEAEWLERPFDVDEVIDVVRSLNGDKALGPDGFSLAFYQSCWDVIKDDVISMFNEFAQVERFVKSLNAMFIVLIPKKRGAVELKDFLPISLVGRVYKILAKVLANRLKVGFG